MIVENNPSARMQVRSRGQLVAPASCCVCGNGTCDEGYLDLGAFVDYHGTLYLCMLCITQGAETVGMFTPEEVKHFQSQIEKLLAENTLLTSELNNAKQYINNFNALLQSKFSPGDLPDSDSSENVEKSLERTGSGESKSSEPITLVNTAGTSGSKLHDITFD